MGQGGAKVDDLHSGSGAFSSASRASDGGRGGGGGNGGGGRGGAVASMGSKCGEVSCSAPDAPAAEFASGTPGAIFSELTSEARALERRREEVLDRASAALRAVVGPEARLVKATSVAGRMVFVVDGAVSEDVRDQLYQCLQTDAFRKTEFARPDTREFRHHIVEYSVEKLRRTELFQVVCRLVDALFSSQQALPLQVYRIYTNAVMFGDAGFVHRDSCEPEHVTAIVYPNPEWTSEMGGETLFYDEAGEIVEVLEPRPGRLVLFRGCIMHKGSPPSRLFWGSRYTTAFKFAVEDSSQEPSPPGSDPVSRPFNRDRGLASEFDRRAG